MFIIPENFAHQMLVYHGADGQTWLDRLPIILATCEQRWKITLSPPFAHLSYHYAAPAVRSDGTPVVVKACSPTNEFIQEAEALRLFNGRGIAQLLEYDLDNEVLLLPRDAQRAA